MTAQSTERARRCRERRRQGLHLVTLKVHAAAVADLVRVGRLGEDRRADRVAIEDAIAGLPSDVLRGMSP